MRRIPNFVRMDDYFISDCLSRTENLHRVSGHGADFVRGNPNLTDTRSISDSIYKSISHYLWGTDAKSYTQLLLHSGARYDELLWNSNDLLTCKPGWLATNPAFNIQQIESIDLDGIEGILKKLVHSSLNDVAIAVILQPAYEIFDGSTIEAVAQQIFKAYKSHKPFALALLTRDMRAATAMIGASAPVNGNDLLAHMDMYWRLYDLQILASRLSHDLTDDIFKSLYELERSTQRQNQILQMLRDCANLMLDVNILSRNDNNINLRNQIFKDIRRLNLEAWLVNMARDSGYDVNTLEDMLEYGYFDQRSRNIEKKFIAITTKLARSVRSFAESNCTPCYALAATYLATGLEKQEKVKNVSRARILNGMPAVVSLSQAILEHIELMNKHKKTCCPQFSSSSTKLSINGKIVERPCDNQIFHNMLHAYRSLFIRDQPFLRSLKKLSDGVAVSDAKGRSDIEIDLYIKYQRDPKYQLYCKYVGYDILPGEVFRAPMEHGKAARAQANVARAGGAPQLLASDEQVDQAFHDMDRARRQNAVVPIRKGHRKQSRA
jgi:hypothetical protein